MSGPATLQAFIDAQGIDAQLLHLSAPTPTVEAAAAVVGCAPEQVIKTILFRVDGAPVVTITAGLAHIDRRTLAARYDVGRKKVKLANADDVITTLGFMVGGVPPIGFGTALPVLIDPRVLAHAAVYGGGGDEHTLVQIAPAVIVAVNDAQVFDLHRLPDSHSVDG